MTRPGGAVHVVTTKREYKGKVYVAHLLRRSYREDGKVKNETVGNLSHLPEHVVEIVRRALKGETFPSLPDAFQITSPLPHGHIQAVRRAMHRLGFEELLGPRPSRERDLVVGMVAARIVAPRTKLATTRWWQSNTLAEDLGIQDAREGELYAAMDWLLARQEQIEHKLVRRHLSEDSLVLYDLSSSYFEGEKCPLARLGHNRDGKKGKLQVNYGLVTDQRGCPVAISVFEGNTSDSLALLPQVRKLKEGYGLKRFVAVGDRGMISAKATQDLQAEGLDWITALKSSQIRELVESGHLQLGLFDERNLFEVFHPDYPGERLVACRNPELAKLRAKKRESLLDATRGEFGKVKRMVERGQLRTPAEIGLRAGKVADKYKVAKHFALEIDQGHFDFHVLKEQVEAEARLDGIYVIRSSVPKERMSLDDTVRSYKLLSTVERAFRSLKTVDLKVRPIHHRLEDRVRGHIFLCMLAYYVEWHLREAWRPLLFADEDQQAKKTRDPVAPAQRSEAAELKAATHQLPDGSPAHSFQTLLDLLGAITRNTCRPRDGGDEAPSFKIVSEPNTTQRRALSLVEAITP